MSERTDKKLQEVPVAHYVYRHEAEFAAGFLDHAEIPYRLQVDDPALGVSVSASATIWVRQLDVPRAREVLELDGGPAQLHGTQASPVRRTVNAVRQGRSEEVASMPLRERLVAVAGGVGVLGIGALALGDGGALIATGLVALVLVVVGLTGKAPRLLREILSSVSGNAP